MYSATGAESLSLDLQPVTERSAALSLLEGSAGEMPVGKVRSRNAVLGRSSSHGSPQFDHTEAGEHGSGCTIDPGSGAPADRVTKSAHERDHEAPP